MIRLILDYYRRWSLVLAIGAVPLLILGCWIAVEPKTPIEFIVALLPIWILQLFDLSRGSVRVLQTLPLTLRQIGRSRWLVNVLIPAVIVAALLFLGAGLAVLWHPYQAFPLHRLCLASLSALVWLGTVFIPWVPASRIFSNWRQHLFSTLFIVLLTVVLTFWMVIRAVTSFSGFLSSQNAAKSPVMLAILLAGGLFLTFVGWFRAERFDPARGQPGCPKKAAGAANSRLNSSSIAPHQPPESYGGIPFLLRTTFIHRFLICLPATIFLALVLAYAPGILGSPDVINSRQGFFGTIEPTMIILGTLFIFLGRSILRHLLFLRTLPISAAKLAAVIIALEILPFIATGMVMAGIADLSLGTPAAVTVLKGCILILAPMALWIFFAIWRGDGIQAYALMMVTIFLSVLVNWPGHNVSFLSAGSGAAAAGLLAWLLTYYALLRGSRAYRVRTHPLGRFTRDAGR